MLRVDVPRRGLHVGRLASDTEMIFVNILRIMNTKTHFLQPKPTINAKGEMSSRASEAGHSMLGDCPYIITSTSATGANRHGHRTYNCKRSIVSPNTNTPMS